MNKVIRNVCLVFCCLALACVFTGCSIQDIFGGSSYKSAYQTAVENGYQGTEDEWLRTLEDGKKGQSLYEKAVADGTFDGTFEEFMLMHFKGSDIGYTIATNMAMRSSVKVVCQKESGHSTSNGSGTIISYNETTQEAHIVTCYHVIVDTTNTENYVLNSIKVYFYGAEKEDNTTTSSSYIEQFASPATFIGGALYSDIAFLKVTISASDWQKFKLRVAEFDTSDVELGQKTIIVGNSNGKNLNAVRANISKQNEETTITNIDGSSGFTHIHVMRVNAIIAHGNSGGGMFDGNAKLIGVINAKSANSEEESNFNYSIPAYLVKAIYENVLNQLKTSTNSWAMAKKYKLGLDLAVTDVYTDIDEDTGYIYTRDKVIVQSGVIAQTFNLNRDILVSAKIKRSNEIVKTKTLDSVYDLGEFMWYAQSGDRILLEYKNVNTGIIEQAELYLKGAIADAEWKDVGSIRGYGSDLTKC